MRRKLIAPARFILSCLCIAALSPILRADPPASQPAQAMPSGNLQGTVTGVEGMVQVKFGPDKPWQKCSVGMSVDQGTQFRTGLRSAVQFVIPPDQTVTLDRLGTVTLLQAVNNNGKVTTDLGMQYGRTRYEIEAAGIQHLSTIRSPNSTLAVRGTTVSLTDQRPFPPEAVSLTGTAQYETAKREIAVGGHGTGIATAEGNLPPAQAALLASIIDPGSQYSRTPEEQELVATVLTHGSVVTESKPSAIPIVSGGIPPTNQQILATVSDPLTFILRWNANTNLDLYMDAPLDASGQQTALLYPASGLNVDATGAKIPFNNVGGLNGGFEIAEFPAPVIPGKYAIGINYVSGQPTQFSVRGFLNGQPVQLFTGNPFATQPVLTGTVGPRPTYVNTSAAIGLVEINSIFSGSPAAERASEPAPAVRTR
ncbi:MAG TPA: hypothetical protein VMD30_04385 [Tepidisphaeraceae bacterium]|nr:hypothetical protein [Tepidisphaeraceae bacterium]